MILADKTFAPLLDGEQAYAMGRRRFDGAQHRGGRQQQNFAACWIERNVLVAFV